jgi:hypothetical protein
MRKQPRHANNLRRGAGPKLIGFNVRKTSDLKPKAGK